MQVLVREQVLCVGMLSVGSVMHGTGSISNSVQSEYQECVLVVSVARLCSHARGALPAFHFLEDDGRKHLSEKPSRGRGALLLRSLLC